MAQTKRKRQTKHRGNAAGIVEARGRTGRASSTAGKGKNGDKVPRADRPPSWRSAFIRAMVASLALLLIGTLLLHNGALGFFFPVILAVYTVLGYQTDKFLFNRRMRRKAAGKVAS
jgi:hypothetical protein